MRLRRGANTALGLLGAVAIMGAVRLRLVEAPRWHPAEPRPVSGVMHLHSEISHDSRVRLSAFAQAARRLRHQFIVLTDHDAHTQQPSDDDGLLILQETELTARQGHLIALRTRTAESVPKGAASERLQPSDLTRELRDIDAVQRFGMWPVVAHPEERKAPWTGMLPDHGGVEVLNAAAQLRALAAPLGLGIVPVALAALVRREALAWSVYGAPNTAPARWDENASLALRGLCGVDAHGWLPVALELSQWTVMLDDGVPWPEPPHRRAAALFAALQAGHFACVAQLGPALPHFAFFSRAAADGRTAALQVQLDVAPHTARDEFELRLYRGGEVVAHLGAPTLVYERPPAGVYRAEVWARLPGLLWGRRPSRVLVSQRLVVPQQQGRSP